MNLPTFRLVATAVAALLLPVAQGFAQSDAPKAPADVPAPNVKRGAPAQAPNKPRVQVPMDQALLLARATLLALNDANRSGNYTVLRDLGSPEFQARNSAADLGIVFSEMRKSGLSLFSVLLLSPQLSAAPELDNDGRLRVSGFVPMRPQQVKFDLLYEQAGGQWKLLNLGISTTPPEQQEPQSQAPAAQQAKPEARNAPAARQPAPAKPVASKSPPPAKSSPAAVPAEEGPRKAE